MRRIADPDLPPRSKPVTPHGPTARIEIKLQEGKKRQIRRMTAAVGLPTLRLIRVAIGPIRLGSLEPGHLRHLTMKEVEELKTSEANSKNQKAPVQHAVASESREQVVQIFLIRWILANNRLNLRVISPNILGLYKKTDVSLNRSSRFDLNRFPYGRV